MECILVNLHLKGNVCVSIVKQIGLGIGYASNTNGDNGTRNAK